MLAVGAVLVVFPGRHVLGVVAVSPRRLRLTVGGPMLCVRISVAGVVDRVVEDPIVDVHER